MALPSLSDEAACVVCTMFEAVAAFTACGPHYVHEAVPATAYMSSGCMHASDLFACAGAGWGWGPTVYCMLAPSLLT
jgi:hypothetical protein